MAIGRLRHLVSAARRRGLFVRKTAQAEYGVNLELPMDRAVPRRSGYLSVVLIAKNEAPDIAEWLQFQHLVGVEHAYVYDDGSTDETRDVLAAFERQGFVTVIPWSRFIRTTGQQYLSYAHALATFGRAWRWMAFIDRDEYLFPVADESLPTVLSRYEDLPAVVVPWHIFGFNGHEKRPLGLVMENYTQRLSFPPPEQPGALLKWKSIVNPAAVAGIGTASFFRLTDGRMGGYTEDRRWMNEIPGGWRNASTKIFRLNHYFTQSKEDFIRRRSSDVDVSSSQERSQHNVNRVHAMAQAIEAAEAFDDHLILRYVDRMPRQGSGIPEPIAAPGQALGMTPGASALLLSDG